MYLNSECSCKEKTPWQEPLPSVEACSQPEISQHERNWRTETQNASSLPLISPQSLPQSERNKKPELKDVYWCITHMLAFQESCHEEKVEWYMNGQTKYILQNLQYVPLSIFVPCPDNSYAFLIQETKSQQLLCHHRVI